MIEIRLTRGKTAIIDDIDLELVAGHSWCAHRERTRSIAKWSAGTSIGGKYVKMHRLILGLHPGDPEVDHRDGDGLNNRRENLRLATKSQNGANSLGKLTIRKSKYKGVSWDKEPRRKTGGHWRAQIRVNGKAIVRLAESEFEAARLYNELALEHYGEFARLNSVS